MIIGARNRRDVRVRTQLREDFAQDPDFDAHETFVLKLADGLPDLCARHGEPAPQRIEKDFDFRPRQPGLRSKNFRWVQRTTLYEIAFLLHAFYLVATFRNKDANPASTVLEGEWPVCAKCLRRKNIWQYFGHSVLLAGVGLLIAIFIEIQISTSDHLPVPLVVAFFPGWLPFGLLVAMLIYRHSGTLVLFRPIIEYTEVEIRAHPRFADAVESRGTATEIREW